MLSILCIGIQSSMLSQMNKVSLSVASTAFFLFLFLVWDAKLFFPTNIVGILKMLYTQPVYSVGWTSLTVQKKKKKERPGSQGGSFNAKNTSLGRRTPPSPKKKDLKLKKETRYQIKIVRVATNFEECQFPSSVLTLDPVTRSPSTFSSTAQPLKCKTGLGFVC